MKKIIISIICIVSVFGGMYIYNYCLKNDGTIIVSVKSMRIDILFCIKEFNTIDLVFDAGHVNNQGQYENNGNSYSKQLNSDEKNRLRKLVKNLKKNSKRFNDVGDGGDVVEVVLNNKKYLSKYTDNLNNIDEQIENNYDKSLLELLYACIDISPVYIENSYKGLVQASNDYGK